MEHFIKWYSFLTLQRDVVGGRRGYTENENFVYNFLYSACLQSRCANSLLQPRILDGFNLHTKIQFQVFITEPKTILKNLVYLLNFSQ